MSMAGWDNAEEAPVLIPAQSDIQVRPWKGFITFPGWQRCRGDGSVSSWQAQRHPLFTEYLGMLRSKAPHKHGLSLQRI